MDELSDQIRAYYDATIEPTKVARLTADGTDDRVASAPITPSNNGDEHTTAEPFEFAAVPHSDTEYSEVVMSSSDEPASRKRVWMVVAAAVAVPALVVGGLVAVSRDDDEGAAIADDTVPQSTAAGTSPAAAVTPGSSAKAVVPADARFRLPFTVAATADALPADWENAAVADDGGLPLRIGALDELPSKDRLSFLAEFCEDGPCSRGYAFIDLSGNTDLEDWEANRPFHIRHGFVNTGTEPLGPGFDLAVYIFSEVDDKGIEHSIGPTQRYTTDFIVQGESDACGPTYGTQTGTVTCEWFVHDFPDGLPEGRWVIWAVWEAPCRAWEDMGITECADPDEVISLFSSAASAPWN